MGKRNARYESKCVGGHIYKISELVSIRYTTHRDDIHKHINKLAGLIKLHRSMGSTVDDALAIGILVASITVPYLMPATAAIKTLTESVMKWEEVSSHLIEQFKNLRSNSRPIAHSASGACHICGKTNHSTERCFLIL